MRIALISDIHGNLIALEAVLADIARVGVDRTICLGDVAALGPQPHEVVARLRSLGYPSVLGNHELNLIDPQFFNRYRVTYMPRVLEAIAWCAARLDEEDLAYLHTFRPSLEVPLGKGDTLLCVHGSPRSPMEAILATTPSVHLDAMLAGHRATVVACGHSHIPMVRRHNVTLIVNAGSVGQPFDRPPTLTRPPRILPYAEYAILRYEQGTLSVALRRVPVDQRAVGQAVRASGLPLRDILLDSI